MTSDTITLTQEQEEAVDAMVSTIVGDSGGTLTVGGYAGTGKTTIIKEALSRARKNDRSVAVSAFTGKAVSVLKNKGVYGAQTLHSLMYRPDKKADGSVEWVLKEFLDVDAVVVDEASMINTSLYDDLLSFNVPVVFVGDHGQLEPIGDNPKVMVDPQVKLETIHRQAAKSPVLQFAHVVRQGKMVDWGTVPDCELRKGTRVDAQNTCHEYDAIICGFNKTRIAYNNQVRKNRGISGPPQESERLICLRNTRDKRFFNGMMLNIETVHGFVGLGVGDEEVLHLHADLIDDNGTKFRGVYIYMLGKNENANYCHHQGYIKKEYKFVDVVVCDFGYALTCHKSQGSEYEKVMVVEEIWHGKWDPRRWRYTAATRAAKELTWVGK